jgi:hypothetical protein
MVAVKVRYEYMVDAMQVGLESHELHLRALAAINEKITVLDLYQL